MQQHINISVKDLYLSLRITMPLLIFSILLLSISGMLVFFDASKWIILIAGAISILFFMFTLKTWRSYNKGIQINSKNNTLIIPASDVENCLSDILTLKRFRDLARRKELKLTDIDRVMIDVKRENNFYTINILGGFTSQNLPFSSRQKRDETRNALGQALKALGKNINIGSSGEIQ